MEYYQNKKGLTFIEILISMSIIMILFATFFYIWNTLDIFRTARDNKRINDLNLLDSAIKTILAINPEINLGQENIIYTSLPDSSSTCGSYNLVKVFSPYSYRCQNSANYLRIDGNGWLPLDFRLGQIIGVSVLPIDPLNNQDYFYAYQVKGNRYKLTAKFESKKYLSKMLNDGGFEPTLYEVGSNLRIPSPHSGLVGYWNFDETGSTAYDLSGYNNHGTMYSSTTITDLHSTSSCKIGYCASFDGVDDYVNLQNTGLNNPNLYGGTTSGKISFIAFIKPTRSSGINYDTILTRIGGIHYLAIVSDSSRILRTMVRDIVNNVNYWPYSNSQISLNQWTHIVFILEAGIGYKFYINGQLDISVSFGNIGIIDYGNDSSIGKQLSSLYNFFKGLIDEVRIYNRALSAEEIKALYEATK